MPGSSKSFRLRFKSNQLQLIPANKIKDSPHNWRVHLDPQRAALQKSLEKIGIIEPVIVRDLGKGFYELIDGHLRTEMIGTDQEVPVLITDLTEAEAREQITVHDPISAMAGQDAEQLGLNLKWLKKQKQDDLAGLVFPDYVIDPLLAADWKPGAAGDLPGREGNGVGGHASQVDPVELTKKERKLIEAAVSKWVEENPQDDAKSEGAILAMICKHFCE